jgi:RHS repeat-associated protein
VRNAGADVAGIAGVAAVGRAEAGCGVVGEDRQRCRGRMGEQDVGDGVSREHLPRSAGVSAADRQGKKDLEEQNDEMFGLTPNSSFDQSGPFADENPWRFSTKQYDPVWGLYYYGYRYYIPEIGRWPSRDPIGEMGGLNEYGFVGNSPTITIDATGLMGCCPRPDDTESDDECCCVSWSVESDPNGSPGGNYHGTILVPIYIVGEITANATVTGNPSKCKCYASEKATFILYWTHNGNIWSKLSAQDTPEMEISCSENTDTPFFDLTGAGRPPRIVGASWDYVWRLHQTYRCVGTSGPEVTKTVDIDFSGNWVETGFTL